MAHFISELRRRLAEADAGGVAVEAFVDDDHPRPGHLFFLSEDQARLVFDGGQSVTPRRQLRVSLQVDERPRAFRSAAWSPGEQGLDIDLPGRLRLAQRRGSARVDAPTRAEVLLSCGERVLRRAIVDLAGTGLGVALEASDGSFSAGTTIDRLRFALPLGTPIITAGRVKHVRLRDDLDPPRLVAGIELVDIDPADARRLDAWVRGQSGPRARERRALKSRGVERATLHVIGRDHVVLRLAPGTLEISLDEGDIELVEGRRLDAVELRVNGECIATGPMEVVRVQSHRGRLVRAVLSWSMLPLADRRRIQRLFDEAPTRALAGK
ncbi:MAG: PilZ domain-containing protein [Deltaproteobacteria bacterium]|nr:PilZ domain-containing protein [Deltaproteobacteria bacterium]